MSKRFVSLDRRALADIIFLYGIPDKYIKVISAMYKKNINAGKLGNEVST